MDSGGPIFHGMEVVASSLLVTVNVLGVVHVWSADSGDLLQRLDTGAETFSGLAMTPSGKIAFGNHR